MIIGISGKARSGKDTFADMLLEVLNSDNKHDYVKVHYSDNLKNRVQNDFNMTWEQVYGSLKEVPDERYPKGNDTFWTPREVLQYIGTEGFRAIEHKFWIRQLFDKFKYNDTKNAIVADCRFPDEVDAVLEVGGIHLRIERDNKDFVTDTQHVSETALDDYDITYAVIENNDTMNGLRESAELIAEEVLRLEETKLKNEIGGV